MLLTRSLSRTTRNIWPLKLSINKSALFRSSRFTYVSYATTVSKPKKPIKRRYLFLGIGLGSLVLAFTLNKDLRKGVGYVLHARDRASTVLITCFRCFRCYKKTLNAHYQTDEEYNEALKKCHKKCALLTRKAIEHNGGIYIKLGQHISASTYIFPPEWTDTMIPLQDQCPTTSFEDVKELIKNDTGKPIQDIFESFEEVPLGTASLAQVHRAVMKDTHLPVAVKVQHASLQEFVPLDIFLAKSVFNLIDLVFPQYPLSWLSDEMQESIYVELDFRKEAENAAKTADYFSNYYKETALVIPKVISAQKRVLVMEYLSGHRPDDVEYMKKHGISTAEVSSCFSHLFNNMIFTPGVGLHCDPHGGNIAIRALDHKKSGHNFEIILYDHGLYRDVPTNIRRSYAHFWLALMEGNESDMRKYAKQFADISDSDFELFSAAITGRDFRNVTNTSRKRSHDEVVHMMQTVQKEGFLSKIIQMLHHMPRIVLLILKTNDLTRNLDEKLDSPLGVKRTFLIMAVYCARTIYEEGREKIRILYHDEWIPTRIWCDFKNWWTYFTICRKLDFYNFGLWMACFLPKKWTNSMLY